MPRPAAPDYRIPLAMLEAGGVNIDCYSVDAAEVWNLAECLNRHATEASRILFPERPIGYRRTTISLAHYAFNKAAAMRCRTAGDTIGATNYDRIAQMIYDRLPAFARW